MGTGTTLKKDGRTKDWGDDLANKMMDRIDGLEKALHEGTSKPSSNVRMAFGGDNPFSPHTDWPVERLKNLEPYDANAVKLLCGNGKVRLSGIGPYLAKMAGMAAKSVGHSGTLNFMRGEGLWEDNYGVEQFTKQFNVVPAGENAVVKTPRGEVRKVALAEGSGMTGGYTVPPQFMNELLTIAGEDAFIEPRCRVLPMTSRTAQFPMLDITTDQAAGTSPYFGGILASWQPEAATINETEPAFRQTEWVAWDLVLYTVASNQLLADNAIGLDALLTQLFGAAITWYKEFAFLQGLGAGSLMPLGVLNAPATYSQSRAVSNRFVLADAAAMMSRLQIRSWDTACWVVHQSVIPQLIQMASGAVANTASTTYIPGNAFAWFSPFGDGRSMGPAAMKFPNAFLNGLPLFITEKVPSLGTEGDVMLIDWSRYVIGQRLEMQIDVSPHYLFRNNQLAWRVVARLDGKPWLNGPIVDQTGWTISPFVKLAA